MPAALLAFNLGVEAGQHLDIAVVLGIFWVIRRLAPRMEGPALRISTYCIGITAAYWLIDRVIG